MYHKDDRTRFEGFRLISYNGRRMYSLIKIPYRGCLEVILKLWRAFPDVVQERGRAGEFGYSERVAEGFGKARGTIEVIGQGLPSATTGRRRVRHISHGGYPSFLEQSFLACLCVYRYHRKGESGIPISLFYTLLTALAKVGDDGYLKERHGGPGQDQAEGVKHADERADHQSVEQEEPEVARHDGEALLQGREDPQPAGDNQRYRQPGEGSEYESGDDKEGKPDGY